MKEKFMADYRYKKGANKHIKNINEKKNCCVNCNEYRKLKTLKYMLFMKH